MYRDAPSLGLGLGLSLRQYGAGFTGLLDAYTGAAAAYSLRKLSSSTSNVVRVRRASDNSEQDFTAAQVADGTLTTFCGVGNGFVETWYDQSGNGNDATQATIASQPKIVDAGALVSGGLDFDNVNDTMVTINTDSFGTSSRSIFAVCSPASIGVNSDGILQLSTAAAPGTGWFLTPELSTRTNAITWISSTPASTVSNNLISNIYTSGNLHAGNAMWLDGTSVARTSGTDGAINTTTSVITIGSGAFGANPFDGAIAEVIIYKSDESANRVGIEANINDHYNIYA